MTGWRVPPEPIRISDYPFYFAGLDPGRPALLSGDDVLTYQGLAQRVDLCARALHAWGVRAGDRVAVLSAPRPEVVVTFLATARLGGIWLGLNPAHTVHELCYVLQDAKPRLVFTAPSPAERDYAGDAGQAVRLTGSRAEVVPLAGLRDHDPFLDRAAAAEAGGGFGCRRREARAARADRLHLGQHRRSQGSAYPPLGPGAPGPGGVRPMGYPPAAPYLQSPHRPHRRHRRLVLRAAGRGRLDPLPGAVRPAAHPGRDRPLSGERLVPDPDATAAHRRAARVRQGRPEFPANRRLGRLGRCQWRSSAATVGGVLSLSPPTA